MRTASPHTTPSPQGVTRALSLEVPLVVLLGERRMRAADVLALVPGSIIELPKSADAELELLVNNKPIGLGQAVKVGENFGVRVSSIGGQAQRLDALGDAAL